MVSRPREMSTDSEDILHDTVNRREPLELSGRLETPHLALTLLGRLMGNLRAVVRVLIRWSDAWSSLELSRLRAASANRRASVTWSSVVKWRPVVGAVSLRPTPGTVDGNVTDGHQARRASSLLIENSSRPARDIESPTAATITAAPPPRIPGWNRKPAGALPAFLPPTAPAARSPGRSAAPAPRPARFRRPRDAAVSRRPAPLRCEPR